MHRCNRKIYIYYLKIFLSSLNINSSMTNSTLKNSLYSWSGRYWGIPYSITQFSPSCKLHILQRDEREARAATGKYIEILIKSAEDNLYLTRRPFSAKSRIRQNARPPALPSRLIDPTSRWLPFAQFFRASLHKQPQFIPSFMP